MDSYTHEIINDDTRLQLYFVPITGSNFYSPPHWHGHLEIIFMQAGFMDAFINDQKYTLKKDDMLVVNPRELHATRPWGDADYLLLQIPFDYLSRVISNVSLLQFQAYFPSVTTNSGHRQLAMCLFELARTYKEKEDGYLLHFSSVAYEFLYILYRDFSRQISPQAKEKDNRNLEKMDEVIRYVKNNYKNNISLKDAASLLNISPEYFCRLFKKHTGQTFLAYLNAVRMSRFYQDLMATDYSVTDLMERHGITNYKVLIRDFKQTYGITPNKLRNRL